MPQPSLPGPYRAEPGGVIRYIGNKLSTPIDDIRKVSLPLSSIEKQAVSLGKESKWSSISRINTTINFAINEFFTSRGASFVPLPLTTRMISSPGAVYGKNINDFTTETCPITIKWFNYPYNAYLSESSQIYLELALLQKGINQVFASYHSFRNEKADATHVPEFHHTEYEGKISQINNLKIIEDLLRFIITNLLAKNDSDLAVFLQDEQLQQIDSLLANGIYIMTLQEALDELMIDTKDEKYKNFSLRYFREWEEIRITQIVGGIVGISDMPLLEVPFYHALKLGSDPQVADNTDIIWPGYREIAGSGQRIKSPDELDAKIKMFNLPRSDYEPYLFSRSQKGYQATAGFGIGLERLLQGLLQMPFITSAMIFPRIHNSLKP